MIDRTFCLTLDGNKHPADPLTTLQLCPRKIVVRLPEMAKTVEACRGSLSGASRISTAIEQCHDLREEFALVAGPESLRNYSSARGLDLLSLLQRP